MKEIEVKVLEIDPKDVVAKLKQLGGKKVEQGLVHAKGYDFPDDCLVKKGQYVRVRKIADRIEVVFKNPIKGAEFKMNEEIEFRADDFEAACEVFRRLGMKNFADMQKYRATYLLGNVKVEFDKYAGLPWFFEVEAPTEAEVKETVALLGFDFNDREKVTARIIKEIYGESVHFTSFSEKGESPDYDKLFE
ncbi:class IV adenylate cyclase [Candidatus Woesearchaeota archaeon]|nr:class IV adenylate cyclase [Candidatus Woesearchaeota archaeon]